MITVLDVSIVDLYAAEPYFVTDTPKELNRATEITEQ